MLPARAPGSVGAMVPANEFERACFDYVRAASSDPTSVPDEILLKPAALNEEETAIVRQHPVVGENICAPLKSLRRILPAISIALE